MKKGIKNKTKYSLLINSILWIGLFLIILNNYYIDQNLNKFKLNKDHLLKEQELCVINTKNILESTLEYEDLINKRVLDEVANYIKNEGNLRVRNNLKDDNDLTVYLGNRILKNDRSNETYIPIVDRFGNHNNRTIILYFENPKSKWLNEYITNEIDKNGVRKKGASYRIDNNFNKNNFYLKKILRGRIHIGFNQNYKSNDIYYGRYEALKNKKGLVIGMIFIGTNITNIRAFEKIKMMNKRIDKELIFMSRFAKIDNQLTKMVNKISVRDEREIEEMARMIKLDNTVNTIENITISSDKNSKNDTTQYAVTYTYFDEIDRILFVKDKINRIDSSNYLSNYNLFYILIAFVVMIIFNYLMNKLFFKASIAKTNRFIKVINKSENFESDITELENFKNEKDEIGIAANNISAYIINLKSIIRAKQDVITDVFEIINSEQYKLKKSIKQFESYFWDYNIFVTEQKAILEKYKNIQSQIVANSYSLNKSTASKNEIMLRTLKKIQGNLEKIKTEIKDRNNNKYLKLLIKIIDGHRISESLKLLYYNTVIESEKAGKHGVALKFIAQELNDISEKAFKMQTDLKDILDEQRDKYEQSYVIELEIIDGSMKMIDSIEIQNDKEILDKLSFIKEDLIKNISLHNEKISESEILVKENLSIKKLFSEQLENLNMIKNIIDNEE